MKKILFSIGIAFAFVLNVSAVTSTVNLTAAGAAGSVTNVPTLLSNGVNVVAFTLTSAANNTATVWIYDTPASAGTNLTFTVGAYSNITSYVTNYITTWTNYYGVTNSVTNLALVDITNSVAASTNNYPKMYVLTAGTNSTVQFNNLNTRFQYGVTATNAAGGAATLILQYTQ